MSSDNVNVIETDPCVCWFCSLVLCDILSANTFRDNTTCHTSEVISWENVCFMQNTEMLSFMPVLTNPSCQCAELSYKRGSIIINMFTD